MRTMWRWLCLAAVIFSCKNEQEGRRALPSADDTFVEAAARTNVAEIRLGELAILQANHNVVKGFAQQMVADHNALQHDLKVVADNFDDVDWPESLDSTHQAIYDKLKNLDGYSFDSTFVASQLQDHNIAVELYLLELDSGKETAVKEYARKSLATLKRHRDHVDSLNTALRAIEQSPPRSGHR